MESNGKSVRFRVLPPSEAQEDTMTKGRDPIGWLLTIVVILGAVACGVAAIKSPPKNRSSVTFR